MPRLSLSYRQILDILLAHGFEEQRHGSGSHRRFRAVIDDKVALVTLAYHKFSDEPVPSTLQSIIRQSQLPKSVFRS